MFTRHVTMKLKNNALGEFSRVLTSQVIPILKSQKGFRDEVVLVSTETLQAIGISFWDTREDAELYNRTEYPGVLGTLSALIDGTPKIETFEVLDSTIHKIAAKGA